jgi:hypothetical protein
MTKVEMWNVIERSTRQQRESKMCYTALEECAKYSEVRYIYGNNAKGCAELGLFGTRRPDVDVSQFSLTYAKPLTSP